MACRCECGCGGRTPLAARTRNREGVVKGQPLRFIRGHELRLATQRRAAQTTTPKWIAEPGPLDTPCHIWQRSIGTKGYGLISVGGVVKLAHRHVWEEANGPIPDGHELHHRCEQKPCVNEDHLEVCTSQEHHDRHPRPRKPRQLALSLGRGL
jgi:HNH endonuclease